MERLRRIVLAAGFALAAPAARAGDFEAHFPEDTDQFLYLDWRQLTGAPLFAKHLADPVKKALAGETALKRYLDVLGVDLFKDVDYVALAMPRAPGTDLVVVVGGAFDPADFAARWAKQAEKEKDRYSVVKGEKLTAYKMATGPGGKESLLFSVEAKKAVITSGSLDVLAKGWDRAARKQASVVKNKVVTEAVGAIAKDTTFVAVGDETTLGQLGINDPNLAKLLKKLNHLKVHARIDTGIKVDGALVMADADSAKELKPALVELIDQVKPVAEVIALNEPAARPLAEATRNLKVTTKGASILLSVEVTGETIEAIMKLK